MELRDIIEIQQVQALYGHAVDWPDQSLLPKVFTKDAVFDGRPSGGESELYVGLDAICAWFALGKPPHPRVHHMMNVWVYEQDGEVRVKAKWIVRALQDGVIISATTTTSCSAQRRVGVSNIAFARPVIQDPATAACYSEP